MRTWIPSTFARAASFALIVAAALAGGCRSGASSSCPPAGAPACPAPCATPAPACPTYADPVYSGGCAGDPGIGRDGTGAFAR
jgi:hypothetical protein